MQHYDTHGFPDTLILCNYTRRMQCIVARLPSHSGRLLDPDPMLAENADSTGLDGTCFVCVSAVCLFPL